MTNRELKEKYSRMRDRNARKGYGDLDFSFEEFKVWFWQQPRVGDIIALWVGSDYNLDFKPSVDRLNDFIGYKFDNMQLITLIENLTKERTKLYFIKKPRRPIKNRSTAIGRPKKTSESIANIKNPVYREDFALMFDMYRLKRSVDRLGLMHISLYSKTHNVSRKTVYNMISDGRLSTIVISDVKFIITKDGDTERTYREPKAQLENKEVGDRSVPCNQTRFTRCVPVLSE